MLRVNVIKKIYDIHEFLTKYGFRNAKILNAGSSSTSFGNDCVNVDIRQKSGVACICDVHQLPFWESTFDIVLLSAVLQYCQNPYAVASEIYRVLKPNGLVYVDAPFIQPYCPDTPDLFRFTKDALMLIFKKFEIEKCDTSIAGGSSLAFYCQALADNITGNRYIDFILRLFISICVLPFSFLNFKKDSNFAGALYLIAKKNLMIKEYDK